MSTPTKSRCLRAAGVLLTVALLTGCAGPGAAPRSGGPGGGRSTQDARVRSFRGQVPPDVFAGANGTWVGRAGPTSLAALRGRVVYVQFAFPT